MNDDLQNLFDDANGHLAVGEFEEAIGCGLQPNDLLAWTSLSLGGKVVK